MPKEYFAVEPICKGFADRLEDELLCDTGSLSWRARCRSWCNRSLRVLRGMN